MWRTQLLRAAAIALALLGLLCLAARLMPVSITVIVQHDSSTTGRYAAAPIPALSRRAAAAQVAQHGEFRSAVCSGRVHAGPALEGGTWVAPMLAPQPARFNPEGCCRDRYALLDTLQRQGLAGWAAELGVASGGYSREMLRRTEFAKVFSVDMWASDRGHDHKQRAGAIAAAAAGAGPAPGRSCVLWAKFDEVKDAFPERLFDFVYVDGYAHTGEEGGRTIRDWYGKVRSGGVFAGHDYDPVNYPLVVEAVDAWARAEGLEIHVIGPANNTFEPAADNDCCPSWYVVKP